MSQIDIRFFSRSLNRHTSFKMYIPDDKRNYGGVYDKQNMKTLFILDVYKRQSVSCSTPVSTTRSVRPTTVLLRWTGWSRSRKEVSQLLLLLLLHTGRSTESILSILPDTLTLLLKLSVRCEFLTVLLQFYVLRAVLSPSQKLYGVRQTSIMFREWHTSTRWTSWVQTSIML